MADTFKVLGQLSAVAFEPTPTVATILYAVPVAAVRTAGAAGVIVVAPKAIALPVQALVSSIVVCNQHSATNSFSIGLQTLADWTDSAPLTAKQYLFKGVDVATKTTKILKLGLTLAPGDRIVAYATLAGGVVSITAMGIEVQ